MPFAVVFHFDNFKVLKFSSRTFNTILFYHVKIYFVQYSSDFLVQWTFCIHTDQQTNTPTTDESVLYHSFPLKNSFIFTLKSYSEIYFLYATLGNSKQDRIWKIRFQHIVNLLCKFDLVSNLTYNLTARYQVIRQII